jgi:hypothetical protein
MFLGIVEVNQDNPVIRAGVCSNPLPIHISLISLSTLHGERSVSPWRQLGPGSNLVSLASLSLILTAVTMLVRTPVIKWTDKSIVAVG